MLELVIDSTIPLQEFKKAIGIEKLQLYTRKDSKHQYANTSLGTIFMGVGVNLKQPIYISKISNCIERPDLNYTMWAHNKNHDGICKIEFDNILCDKFMQFRFWYDSIGGSELIFNYNSRNIQVNYDNYCHFSEESYIVDTRTPPKELVIISELPNKTHLKFSKNLKDRGDFNIDELFETQSSFWVFFPKPNDYYLTIMEYSEVL